VLRAEASHKGRVLHIEDAIIAATAIEYDLILVTRNLTDFRVTGLTLYNPWEKNEAPRYQ
jgi:predicted nucleic acid-binding protein